MSSIPIGFGTYGLPNEDIFEAIPRLARIGYQAVELTIAEGWPTAPGRLSAEQRRRLKALIEARGFGSPVLMDLLHPFAAPDRGALGEKLREAFQLANDLHFTQGKKPIYTITLGNNLPDWESGRGRIVEMAAWMTDLAREHDVILALEPHAGSNFDRPEKAAWLMETLRHPHARLNLDVSHFLALDLDVDAAIALLVPYAVHSHVKDVEAPSAKPQFLLPGQGGYDFAGYFRKLRDLNFAGDVVVEVSGQIWKAPGYQPWQAAEYCFDALSNATAVETRT